MRTVHETEALRPSDPVPKSMQVGGGPAKGSSKFKIIIKTPQSHATGQDDTVDEDSNGDDDDADNFTELLPEHGFSEEELVMPLKRLHGLCHMQVKWAERDGEEIKRDCKILEEQYKKEWQEKEVLLKQVIQSELDWHERRKAVLSGAADVQFAPEAASNGAEAEEAQRLPNGGSGDRDSEN